MPGRGAPRIVQRCILCVFVVAGLVFAHPYLPFDGGDGMRWGPPRPGNVFWPAAPPHRPMRFQRPPVPGLGSTPIMYNSNRIIVFIGEGTWQCSYQRVLLELMENPSQIQRVIERCFAPSVPSNSSLVVEDPDGDETTATTATTPQEATGTTDTDSASRTTDTTPLPTATTTATAAATATTIEAAAAATTIEPAAAATTETAVTTPTTIATPSALTTEAATAIWVETSTSGVNGKVVADDVRQSNTNSTLFTSTSRTKSVDSVQGDGEHLTGAALGTEYGSVHLAAATPTHRNPEAEMKSASSADASHRERATSTTVAKISNESATEVPNRDKDLSL